MGKKDSKTGQPVSRSASEPVSPGGKSTGTGGQPSSTRAQIYTPYLWRRSYGKVDETKKEHTRPWRVAALGQRHWNHVAGALVA